MQYGECLNHSQMIGTNNCSSSQTITRSDCLQANLIY